jgi:hypothetical protein
MFRSKQFCIWLLCLFAGSMLPIFVLNVILARQSGITDEVNIAASVWQERTHGITDGTANQLLFKTLRLKDRLQDVDTVVFGSSTSYGITQAAFPPSMRVYNFSTSGRTLPNIIGEAEYILERSSRVRLMIIPLEWSLGFNDLGLEPHSVNLSYGRAIAAIGKSDGGFPWSQVASDALSSPSIRNLFRVLYGIVKSKNPIENAVLTFTSLGSPEYTCDGAVVKNFNIKLYGRCEGFAYDGSYTYVTKSDGKRLRADQATELITEALTPGTCGYCLALSPSAAEPNPLSLMRLVELAHRLQERGGDAIFFMPPLFPGFEAAYLARADLATQLQLTKSILREWAHREQVLVVDAGQSERFTCHAEEFADVHHARKECYAKIFEQIWRQKGSVVAAAQ